MQNVLPTFWFFGPSGAGKTTLSELLASTLGQRGWQPLMIDGDKLRAGLCVDLCFSENSRNENHRRAAEVARLASSQGIVPIVATMAPQRVQREIAEAILGVNLCWIYVDATLETCRKRDPKKLYTRALGRGNPGDLPFENPTADSIDLHIQSDMAALDACSEAAIQFALKLLEGASLSTQNTPRSLGLPVIKH